MRRPWLLLSTVVASVLVAGCSTDRECHNTLNGVACSENTGLGSWWTNLGGEFKLTIGIGAAWLVWAAFDGLKTHSSETPTQGSASAGRSEPPPGTLTSKPANQVLPGDWIIIGVLWQQVTKIAVTSSGVTFTSGQVTSMAMPVTTSLRVVVV